MGGNQSQRRFLHHAGVDLTKTQRVEEIRPDGCKANPVGVGAAAPHKKENQNVIGVAERRDTDGAVLQILEATNFFGRLWRAGESKERQSAGGSKTGDLRAAGISLKRYIERRPRVVHRPTDEGLHGDIPAAGIYQPYIEAFIGEVSARSGNLIGDNAEELAAKR